MDKAFRPFYRHFYNRTGGFIPSAPLGNSMYPGDYFQLSNGEIVILGNIFRDHIVDPLNAVIGNSPLAKEWKFSEGVSKPYSGRGTAQGAIGGEFEFSRQVLAFGEAGSFLFKALQPSGTGILNWNEIQDQLIIKMTQTVFSFRELYIVTESATADNWTLAVAGNHQAELEIATEAESFGLVDIFGHKTAKTIQSRDIHYYHREERKKPCFFKAKKLIVQDDRLQVFISDMITRKEQRQQWAGDFFNRYFEHDPEYATHEPYNAHIGVLDMLQANQLNPATALMYFKWGNANLDDVEKLFTVYG